MKRAVFAVALVAASSGVASAGGYIGLGIGTAPAVNGSNLESYNATTREDGRSGRLVGGFRFGRFAIEGAIGKFDFVYDDGNLFAFTAYQAQVSGKFTLPLQDGFGVFGRVGLHKQWFNAQRADFDALDVSGTGIVAGVGVEYRLPTALDVSLFVDYQYSRGGMSGERLDFGSTSTRMWTLGATIGF